MARLYSFNLCEINGWPAGIDNFTPGGGPSELWVVRDITAVNFASSQPGYLNGIEITTDPFDTRIYRIPEAYAHRDEYYHWEGRVILQPGQGITVKRYDNNWHIIVSGYQLTLP